MEAARKKQQEELKRASALHAEKQKEREREKREKYLQRHSYLDAGHRLGNALDTFASAKVKINVDIKTAGSALESDPGIAADRSREEAMMAARKKQQEELERASALHAEQQKLRQQQEGHPQCSPEIGAGRRLGNALDNFASAKVKINADIKTAGSALEPDPGIAADRSPEEAMMVARKKQQEELERASALHAEQQKLRQKQEGHLQCNSDIGAGHRLDNAISAAYYK